MPSSRSFSSLYRTLLPFKFLTLIVFSGFSMASDALFSSILPMKERAAVIDELTAKRVSTLLPKLMKQTNLDMWVLISREYNEDPVLKTMLPATWLSARRTTILVFALDKQGQVNAYAVAPYKIGNVFKSAWDKHTQPDQWQALVDLIDKYQPKRIGVNTSKHWAHADGLVVSDQKKLLAKIPAKYQQRLTSAERLAVGWLEQRINEEIPYFKQAVAIAQAIIAQGFSNEVIEPGQTTTDDLVWWLRERVRELKLQTWFHPSVSIQRADKRQFDHESSFTNVDGDNVIQPGDLLHVDFGIVYLRLHTDTQQHAYVLKAGETSPPEYLQAALHSGNQVQDALVEQFKAGRTGNEVLKMAREAAIERGLKPTIYTHPLGLHGHAAGTTIGMWDAQQGKPGDGDYPLHLNTAYSIELSNDVYLEAWQKQIRIMLEEDAFFNADGVKYLNGRQKQLHIIKAR
ncbi:M24 family metallopeptidase [Pseudoalteromonas amylolytica]|uniref:Xaa-Pro aminopeptidase n=1 Tax=Pseudoalteromonas amylolytica TaxID=1859457 RepID=A0A1S1MUB2_9GAMM|nr:Xaa-Pro aminopeptidase [Pseudoalteromonas sp. JW3]OHU90099.1 Xaa-Pro aminopeptidase [Pseudoalteromonas amylolytica]